MIIIKNFIYKIKCLFKGHNWIFGYDYDVAIEESFVVSRKCTRCNKFDSFYNDVDKDKVIYK